MLIRRAFVLFVAVTALACGRRPDPSNDATPTSVDDAPIAPLPIPPPADDPPLDPPADDPPPTTTEDPPTHPDDPPPTHDDPPADDPPDDPPAAPCTEDNFEPNDTQATAKTITVGQTISARSCGGDEDWFRLQVGAGCAVTISIAFTHADGDLDMKLYDAAGAEVDSSSGVTDGEEVTFTATAAGLFAAKIVPYNDAQNSFTLTSAVDCSGTPPPDEPPPEEPPPATGCPNDADADTSASAAPMTTSASGTACTGDKDWYAIDVAAGCTVTATLSLTNANGDIDLWLEDAAGTRLDSSNTYNDVETVDATFAAAGSARIGVIGYGANANQYSLSVSKSCPPPPPPPPATLSCPADDGWEPNDSAVMSLEIFDGETLEGIVCSNDPDVWAFWVPQDCVAIAELSFTDANGDLDLTMAGPNNVQVASSSGTTDLERITHLASATGEHYLTVKGYGSAQNTYDLSASRVCREDFTCPSDDFNEPNDDRGHALHVAEAGGRQIGITCGDDDWYYVDAQPGCTVTATLNFTDALGDLDLEIVDGANDVVGESHGTTDVETADTYVWVAGRIAARVKPYNGAQNDYVVQMDVDCP